MKQKRSSLLFVFVGVVMVVVFILWIFSLRGTLQEVKGERAATSFPLLKEQLRQPISDITARFTKLTDIVRHIPKPGALPPDVVATIEKELQEQQTGPLAQ